MNRRVVVTGLGTVTPYGVGVNLMWKNLINGKSAVGLMDIGLDLEKYTPLGARFNDFVFSKHFNEYKKYKGYLDRAMEFIMVATKEACENANLFVDMNLLDRYKFGVYLGTTTAGHVSAFEKTKKLIKIGEKFNSKSIYRCTPSLWAMIVANYIKAYGDAKTFAIGCNSGGESIGNCYRDIRDGKLDIAIAGGGDAPISQINYLSFFLIRATSRWKGEPSTACRPFSKDRNGMVFGEGAGILVLETLDSALKRKTKIFAEIIGYKANIDGHHIVAPDPKATGYGNLISRLLKDSMVNIEDIGYINCHGTGTLLNDKVETKAIKKAFGDYAYELKISSTKSMMGHSFGGSTAIETVVLIKALNEKKAPPTINYKEFDIECDLNCIPNRAVEIDTKYGLKIAAGFGGSSNAILIKKAT